MKKIFLVLVAGLVLANISWSAETVHAGFRDSNNDSDSDTGLDGLREVNRDDSFICTAFPSFCRPVARSSVTWGDPYCNGPISWDYYQRSNQVPPSYRYFGPGDAACAAPIEWGSEYCNGPISWDYWQKDNQTPTNYRRVRDGDSSCQAPLGPPVIPLGDPFVRVTYTEVCSGGTFGTMHRVKSPCNAALETCSYQIQPPIACSVSVSAPRLQFCPANETVKIGETKQLKVYYWKPRRSSPTCAEVGVELSRILEPDRTRINPRTGGVEVIFKDEPRVIEVTELSNLVSRNAYRTADLVARDQETINRLRAAPVVDTARISRLEDSINATYDRSLNNSLVSVTDSGLVTGVRVGRSSEWDEVEAQYAGLRANAPIKVLSDTVVSSSSTPPQVTLELDPPIVRRGQSSMATIFVTADFPLSCSVRGVLVQDNLLQDNNEDISIMTFTHSGDPERFTYTLPTAPLTSAQQVNISCSPVDPIANPFSPVQRSGQVEVIPAAQEL